MNYWQRITHSKSKIFLFCLLFFIVGVGVSSFFSFNSFIIFCLILISALGLIFSLPAVALAKAGLPVVETPRWGVLIFFIFCFFLGVWRYQISLPDFSDETKIYYYNGRETNFSGVVADIDERIDKQKITINSKLAGKIPVSGKVLLTLPLYPKYQYGDEVGVSCQLKKPEKFDDFDYEKYLARYDIYSVCSFAKISKTNPPPLVSRGGLGRGLIINVLKAKKFLSNGLSLSIREPQNALLQAMLFNNRGGLSPAWMDKFSQTGVTHIIAISGQHIAIISMVLMSVAIGLGISRPKAFWAIAAIIVFYIVMIGAPASAVRSAIMGILVLYAQKVGRLNNSLNLIVFAAAVMLAFNPKVLIFDVGFQLSFMAVIGLIYLVPILEKYFRRLPEFWQVKEIFIMTLAAQIMTLPLIIFYFHRLSLSSFLANILILPTIPFLMVWGFINAVVGAVFLPLGKLLGYVSYFAAGYFLWVVDRLSKVPLSSLQIEWLNIFLVVALYGVIAVWVYNTNKKLKN
ncbi:MAG: ComEC/Rec2 family competence protein [Patescibacteria group bacterium]